MTPALTIMALLTGTSPDVVTPEAASQGAAPMIAEATEWLLEGQPLPADLDARLRLLAPSERMRVIVFLRRSGMLSGAGWAVDDLLAPATESLE
ncbi:hypothetical protein [Paracoccus laeviglucosivorans]|uniref:Uncharacterized protein n=1 Tax=Paracoccus laeviglucosivorans TaxID=1197861 RepID=A0A521DRE3_9RHOB|nr:hypothetical protein [Paracoccus laeviglucosivorans]SMO74172.1 hypothetical protein SAMN06265221_10970 [Paracoccus laeviglucosivorans]